MDMRRITALFVFVLLMPVFCRAEIVSIVELKEQMPAYWEYGAEINGSEQSVMIPVYIPDIEKVPVLRARRQVLDETDLSFLNETMEVTSNTFNEQRIAAERYEWMSGGKNSGFYAVEKVNNPWQAEAEMDLYRVFPENSSVSAGTMMDNLSDLVKQVYGSTIVPKAVWTESPLMKKTKNGQFTEEYYDCGHLTGVGSYGIEGWTTVEEIPVLLAIGNIQNIMDTRTENLYNILHSASSFSYMGPILGEVCVITNYSVFEKTQVIAEDIPLCSFDVIEEQIRKKIEDGELRYVYDIMLGYMVYADPEIEYAESYDEIMGQEFRLMPIWMVEVSESKSGSGRENREFYGTEAGIVNGELLEGARYDYRRHDTGYDYLCFDAQTGELMNQNTRQRYERNMCYPKEVISW